MKSLTLKSLKNDELNPEEARTILGGYTDASYGNGCEGYRSCPNNPGLLSQYNGCVPYAAGGSCYN